MEIIFKKLRLFKLENFSSVEKKEILPGSYAKKRRNKNFPIKLKEKINFFLLREKSEIYKEINCH